MFLPIKPDFRLTRLPWLTSAVCLACMLVFSGQLMDQYEYDEAVRRYCEMPRSRIQSMVFARIQENNDLLYCDDIPYILLHAPNENTALRQLMNGLEPIVGYDDEQSRSYVRNMLRQDLGTYRQIVPPEPGEGLAYYTETWNPVTMVTSSFAHG
ncbi:MAG: hypothetical protein OEW59_09755, partial [Gammaproteobacteria bacterium]|nr:hypothetical protein [Gammaproteobacteria bacterium]